jgi:hypothetical protein
MNAVEIEEAVSKLAEAPFNAQTFPYDFLQAFGLNDAGIRKLKSGDTNKSDLRDGPWNGGVLQRNNNNIHLIGCPPGEVPAADLYDPEAMDTKYPDLRAAHDRNDETLERIYIGRHFRNDTERLEKLFELYTQMTAKQTPKATPAKRGKKRD